MNNYGDSDGIQVIRGGEVEVKLRRKETIDAVTP